MPHFIRWCILAVLVFRSPQESHLDQIDQWDAHGSTDQHVEAIQKKFIQQFAEVIVISMPNICESCLFRSLCFCDVKLCNSSFYQNRG